MIKAEGNSFARVDGIFVLSGEHLGSSKSIEACEVVWMEVLYCIWVLGQNLAQQSMSLLLSSTDLEYDKTRKLTWSLSMLSNSVLTLRFWKTQRCRRQCLDVIQTWM